MPLKTEVPEPTDCICTTLRMASRVVARGYDHALDGTGVSITQFSILKNISKLQPISQMRLSERLELERTTLYRAIDILIRDGLVRATQSAEGPAKILELTAKGRTLFNAAKKQWQLVQTEFIESFGTKRWSELSKLLHEAREHFKETLP